MNMKVTFLTASYFWPLSQIFRNLQILELNKTLLSYIPKLIISKVGHVT